MNLKIVAFWYMIYQSFKISCICMSVYPSQCKFFLYISVKKKFMSSYNFGFCTLRRVCHEYFYRLILFRRIHWHNYYYQVWNFFLHFSTLCFALINQKSKNLMTVWINAGIFTNKYQPCNCYCNFPVKTDILIIIIML